MKNRTGKNLSRFVSIVLLITAIMPIVVFSTFWFYHEFQQFQQQTDERIAEFTTDKREKLKNEVETVLRFIKREMAENESEILNRLQRQTFETHRVASYVHKKAENQVPVQEIQQMVLEALDFSMNDPDATALLVIDSRGNNLLQRFNNQTLKPGKDFDRIMEKSDVQEILEYARLQREGYIYLRSKPDVSVGKSSTRVVFFKWFQPFDWFFVFVEDESQSLSRLRDYLIDRIELLSPAESDYFFLADESGALLLGPYEGDNFFDIKNPQGKPVKSEIETLRESGGGFLEYVLQERNAVYQGSKLSYVAYSPHANWYVGTGMLFEDLENTIKTKRQELVEKIREFISEGAVLLIVLVLIIVLLERILSRLFRRHLNTLTEMLENAVTRSEQQDDEQFAFEESRRLVRNMNRVVQKRVKSEESLRRSELKFRLLFENLRDGCAETDMQGNLIDVNPGFCAMTGYREAELLNQPLKTLVPEKWHELESREIIPQVHKYGFSQVYEKEYLRKDGSGVPVEVQLYAVRNNNGECMSIRRIVRDISQRKEAEKREQEHQKQLLHADRMISLGVLASGMAHEINNPNQFIMTHNALLRDTWDDASKILDHYAASEGDFKLNGLDYAVLKEKVPLFFKNVEKGARRIQSIVNELKEFSNDYPDEAEEMVEINSVIASAVTLTHHMIKKSTHNFSVAYGKNLPQFRGHYQHLEQVFINLLQNACQSLSSPDKSIEVITGYRKEDDRITVIIIDDGVGISETDLDHITDPFYTTRRSQGGTGLGLSISEKIIRQHNGRMSFYSIPGKGTTVTLSLPVKRN